MANKWLMRDRQDSSATMRLFCLPFAGGGASIYRNWQACAPAGVEVVRLQLPGREGRLSELPFTDMDVLVSALIDQLVPEMDLPFAIFGHSLGSLISFALTQQLAQQQLPLPQRLFLSASRPPHLIDQSQLHRMDDQDFVAALRKRGGTPEEVLDNRDLMELFTPLLRADLEVAETWCRDDYPALAVPISLFNGDRDLLAMPAVIPEWQRYSTRPIWSQVFEAGHFFIQSHQSQLQQAVFSQLATPVIANTEVFAP